MKKEIFISVDVETDGTHPGSYSMLSFGACVAGSKDANGNIENFDYKDEKNLFYAELKPISEKFVPETLAVSGLDRDKLKVEGNDPSYAMTAFCEWILAVEKEYDGRAVFTAFPLGFDWMWAYWYICEFSSIRSPFGHSAHYDMKTSYGVKSDGFIRHAVKRRMPKHLLSNLPHTHNALDDAIEQGLLHMNLMGWKP